MLQVTFFRKTKALKVREHEGGRAFIIFASKSGDGSDKFDFSSRNPTNIVVMLSPVELAALCLALQNPKNSFDVVHTTDNGTTKTLKLTHKEDGVDLFATVKTKNDKRSASFLLSRPEAYMLARFAQLLIDKSFQERARNEVSQAEPAESEVVEEEDEVIEGFMPL